MEISLIPTRRTGNPLKATFEFENVSFQYPDGKEEVLSNFNLKIPAGTNVAIVGETGAGKSTLVNLACRFFEPLREESSSTTKITVSEVSCGCTATSGMCFRIPICSPGL